MSLISQGDIKYEGILSHIDMAKSEICLTQGAILSRGKANFTIRPALHL